MKDKILVRGIAVNPVLKRHMEMTFPKESIRTSDKKDFKRGLKILFESILIKRKTVLIYNSSVANIVLVLILKINMNKVLFHLHDPIPHSGILNPIVFISNFLITSLASVVLVFSEKLKEQTKRYYFKKSLHVVDHGMNEFNYIKTGVKKEVKTVIGFFGRNMPYKNYDSFLKAVQSYPKYQFVTVGLGYPDSKYNNLKLYSGYINDDNYYSMMLDVDYLFFSHSSYTVRSGWNNAASRNK